MNLQENAQRIGQSLQDKRASLNLNAGDAARQIKIGEQFVHAMESGAWDKLGPRVYAKGHLLAYARILSADSTKIEDHFGALAAQAQKDAEETLQRTDLMPVRQSMMERVSQSMNHLGYVAATALIAVPAIFALIMAFQSREETSSPIAESATSTTQTTQESTDPVLASMTPVIKTPPPKAAIDLTNLGFESPAKSQDTADKPTGATAPSDDVESNVDSVASASNLDTINPFSVTVSDDVWVEIHNLSGDRLAYGLKNKGWSMQFPTADGLDVRLGNVNAVTARLNDQPFDLAPHTRQDLATFRLAGQQ